MAFAAVFKMRSTGAVIERLFSTRADVPPVLTAKNDPASTLAKAEVADFLPFYRASRTHPPAKYPIVSTSIAVDADRIDEARRLAGCDFNRRGQAIITSRAERLRVCKALGYAERS